MTDHALSKSCAYTRISKLLSLPFDAFDEAVLRVCGLSRPIFLLGTSERPRKQPPKTPNGPGQEKCVFGAYWISKNPD